jgi:hypothetical protein
VELLTLAKSNLSLKELDSRYISTLLDVLEKRKNDGYVDNKLYKKLREEYLAALEKAESKDALRDGFIVVQALAPNPETVKKSVDQFSERLEGLENEQEKIKERIKKLDNLLTNQKISEEIHHSKKREYEVLLSKLVDDYNMLLLEVPDSIELQKKVYLFLEEEIEKTEAEKKVDSSKAKDLDEKINYYSDLQKKLLSAARKMAKLADIEFSKSLWLEGKIELTSTPKIKPAVTTPAETKISSSMRVQSSRQVASTPKKAIQGMWKDIPIGRYIGEISIVGGRFGIFATDRPSIAILRDFANAGPSRLGSASNPKAIEERLRKMIQDKYNVEESDALHPENVMNFAIETRSGIDLLKLINSYYASVGRGAITIQDTTAIINPSAQVLSLSENAGILGRRVLAPDRTLIGVVHELYLDPDSAQLYAFTFKGVPPNIIRNIYRETHFENLSEGNFGAFRNEIAKKLSIPIYEALTPSSVLRYALMMGMINNLNQLETLIESMNPRISKGVDIRSITAQGIILSRFPQNALPKIHPYKF